MNWSFPFFGALLVMNVLVIWFARQIKIALPPPIKPVSTKINFLIEFGKGGKLFTLTTRSTQPFDDRIFVTPQDDLLLQDAEKCDRIINGEYIKDVKWVIDNFPTHCRVEAYILARGTLKDFADRLLNSGWEEVLFKEG